MISVLPLLELRGGLIAAALLKIPALQAFVLCYLGNILPIPFILVFIKKIFAFMKKHNILKKQITKLEKKSLEKGKSIENKMTIGVFLFVAIPLPGTGGWTGALIASLLNMSVKRAFLVIAAGIFTAGVIMMIITYLIPGLFGF
ncbi:hypothetical protein AGMMS49975_28700 [Clostridia bacterium]|nr:hypothetical protein AGMMS49975_28700 [Clostridia bacterium]